MFVHDIWLRWFGATEGRAGPTGAWAIPSFNQLRLVGNVEEQWDCFGKAQKQANKAVWLR